MDSGLHTTLKKLPLHAQHLKLNARIGSFGVWEVPLYYSSIVEEHHAVRNAAGVFDISHMGEFLITGPKTLDYLNDLLPRDVKRLKAGKALYAPLLNEKGGFVDDIIIYKQNDEKVYVIVNADNVDKDYEWFDAHKIPGMQLENLSDSFGLIALQGPKSQLILQEILGFSLDALSYYSFIEWQDGMIARTGYTGEDGFEIMIKQSELQQLWDRLFDSGKKYQIKPAGFGARDTLRLEAAMPLYGHDMNDEISPVEAAMDWAIDLNKNKFIGKDALLNQKANGITKKLVGIEMVDKGIPRHSYRIFKQSQPIGQITSGSVAPTLQKNIALGYVDIKEAQLNNEIQIQVRDKLLNAKVVATPFYKRKKS